MSIERNKKIVLEHFELMSKGESIRALKDFSDEMTRWVIGPPEMNGGTHTKQDLIEVYTHQVPRFFPKGIKITIDRLVSEGDIVTAEGHSCVKDATGIGKHYANNSYVFSRLGISK